MRGLPGQEQPAPPEPAGHPALHRDPRGPPQVGDPRVQAGGVDQGLQVDGGNRGAERPGFQPPRRRGAGREEPPGRPLAEAEGEQQPAPARPRPGRRRRADHRRARRRPARPPPGTRGRSSPGRPGPATVLAGPSQPTAKPNRASSDPAGVRRSARTPPGSSRTAASSVPRSTSTPRLGQRLGQHPLHVHLPDQRQVREGGVRQREVAERDADDAGAEPQVGRWRGVGPGQQRRRHPERAQHLQRAGVQDERARRPGRLGPPVDDPDHRAVVVRLQGQGQPGRAGARHQDVRRQPTPVSRHQASSPPSRCGRSSTSSRRRPGSTT